MKKLTVTFLVALFVLAMSSVSFANPSHRQGGGHGSCNGGSGSGYCYNN